MSATSSVVVVVPTAMPATMAAPVGLTAIIAVRSSIIARSVIVVAAVPIAVSVTVGSIVVWPPPAAAPFVTNVTDLFRV